MNDNSTTRIVIVGGGTGGLSTAAALRQHAEGRRFEVTVIEPSDYHYYQPLWTLVGGGLFPREASRRRMAEVLPAGVNWINQAVAEFVPQANHVVTVDGQRVDYDYLVVAAGLKLDWDKIEGLAGNVGKNGICSNYSYDTVPYTWETLRNFKQGTALFTFPPVPIKCAGAPQKIMYLAEDHFRRTGVRDRVKVLYRCTTDSIFSAPKYAARLMDICRERDIDVQLGSRLVKVDAAARVATLENTKTGERTEQAYDMLHVAPPMSAPAFIAGSPLANAAGFVEVDKGSLQHVRHPNVFALGDCSNLPTSKTAAAIRAQMPVLVRNLVAVSAGRQLPATYDGYTSCPLVTGYGRLILAEFDYNLEPQETFPFDQGKERLSMYLLKKHVLPFLYWKALLAGRRWPWLLPEAHLQAS